MASHDLSTLEQWAGDLLAKVSPANRRKLAHSLGLQLRRRQQQRIRAQQNPSGAAFEPRKLRKQKGAIRRKAMFNKIASARFFRVQASADQVAIGFLGRAAYIANVHQHGRYASVIKDGPRAHYPQRQLLGFSNDDHLFIKQQLLAFLENK